MKKLIREMLTACYNPDTGKIEGCEYGSSIWHHEDRHRQQFKNRYVKFFNHWYFLVFHALCGLFLFVGIPAGLFRGVVATIGIMYLPVLAFNLVLEIDAWIYQIKMFLRR